MTQTLFRGGLLLDPEGDEPREGSLLVSGERIEAVLPPGAAVPGDARVVELAGRSLAPGLIDVHHHGATIFDPIDAPAASLRQDAASMLRHGVTAFLPTTVALTQEELRHRVSGLARAAAEAKEGAAVLGIHLEGPWISAEAPGAQPRDAIRPYDAAEGRDVLDRGEGLVRMVTLAPEAPGAGELLAELERRGIVAALGHTKASAEVAGDGFDRGIRHVTHLFNAMGAFHHREPGAIGAALGDDRATCDLICDGVHVHPAIVRLAARAKGERLVLISDRVEPGPADDFGAGAIEDDGRALRLADGTLAGSSLTLDRAVANAIEWGALSRLEAVSAVTLRPARQLGIEATHGTLRTGARADLALFDTQGRLQSTWIGGDRVWEAGQGVPA